MNEIFLYLDHFDIQQIADSGQCFRMYPLENNTWEVWALNRMIRVEKLIENKKVIHKFFCSKIDFNSFWKEYFDLDTDYGFIKKRILDTKDLYLTKTIEWGSGIRILRQDPWEMIVSFVISQQNNIPRIKSSLKKIFELNNNRFPSPDELLKLQGEKLSSVKLGYREKYLLQIAEKVFKGEFDIDQLFGMSYLEAVEYLKTLPGVGDKVANCIVLFGLHKMEAFPVDVWIKRIIEKRYYNNFSLKNLGLEVIGGIVQQYMFFYERSLS